MSVIQMLKINDKILEKGTVIDYPDVELRSMHLDIARKPFSKEWIIRQIKDLSWQKYNAVQLHFSENEGFRIQSDTLDAIEGFKYKYDDVLSKQDILDIVFKYGVRGVDRIVELGQTMALEFIWDGFKMIETMSRFIYSGGY